MAGIYFLFQDIPGAREVESVETRNMKPRDISILSFGDFHSGGLTALFPDYAMQFYYDKNNILPYSPSPFQVEMYNHFIAGAKHFKKTSKGRQKIIIVNGDATDGNHHGTVQIISPQLKHHMQIFIELMDNFLQVCEFSVKNGDELHFVSGTESHTGFGEYDIKKQYEPIGAEYHDELQLTMNEKRLWWTHEGAKPGKGANEGNALRNFARDLYIDCLKSGKLPPHLITTSHYHKNSYDSYNDNYQHTIHYQVLPSWQGKTRYAIAKSAYQRNDIGMIFNTVTAEGDLRFEPFLMKEKQ